MQTINYTNKTALNMNSSIADVNKCNAGDLNEIKSVVNAINEVNTKVNGKQATILTGTSLPGTVTNGAIFLLYS